MNDTVVTRIWEGDLKRAPVELVHVPNYGKFHRLVVATPYLAWADDSVIRIGDIVIRLIEGKIHGEKVEPLDQVEVEGNQVSITGRGSGSAVAEGRFVEIVAPGDSRETAELSSYSIMGLLALCLGPHAIGDVVFSEPYDASPVQQLGFLNIPVTARIPRSADATELDTAHLILPHLLGDDRSKRSRVVALAWYERGIRASAPLDKLLSYFIGIETLVNAFAADHGPVPEAVDREERFRPVLEGLSRKFAPDMVGQLTQRLVESTLAERFRLCVTRHALQEDLTGQFQTLARLRNDAVHGSPVQIHEEQASQAGDLLLSLLKAEFGLLGKLSWEGATHVRSLTIAYELHLDRTTSN